MLFRKFISINSHTKLLLVFKVMDIFSFKMTGLIVLYQLCTLQNTTNNDFIYDPQEHLPFFSPLAGLLQLEIRRLLSSWREPYAALFHDVLQCILHQRSQISPELSAGELVVKSLLRPQKSRVCRQDTVRGLKKKTNCKSTMKDSSEYEMKFKLGRQELFNACRIF